MESSDREFDTQEFDIDGLDQQLNKVDSYDAGDITDQIVPLDEETINSIDEASQITSFINHWRAVCGWDIVDCIEQSNLEKLKHVFNAIHNEMFVENVFPNAVGLKGQYNFFRGFTALEYIKSIATKDPEASYDDIIQIKAFIQVIGLSLKFNLQLNGEKDMFMQSLPKLETETLQQTMGELPMEFLYIGDILNEIIGILVTTARITDDS